MMDKLLSLLDGLDIAKLLPEVDSLLGKLALVLRLCLLIGPVIMLVLGLIYLLIPPKEANQTAGYRTYFGMGSVKAWRFTQLVAGIIMTVVGLVLFLIARKAVQGFDAMDLMAAGEKAFSLIKTQVICAAVIYVFMMVLTFVMFDRKGNPRFAFLNNFGEPKQKKRAKETKSAKPAELPSQEAEVPATYERQGEQVITADDIVIEGLD